MEDLVEPHLPEVVVDPVELGLVDVLVEVGRERVGRLEVVSERLLDDDPRALRQAGVRQLLHDLSEEEGRDLEVEDGRRLAFDRRADPLVRRRVGEIPRDVREAFREAVEHRLVDLLSGALDRRTRPLAKVFDGPVVDRHADDRAVEQPARLEAVQRPEGHHLRQVARDPEHDEHVALRLLRSGRPPGCGGYCRRRHPIPPPTKVGVRGERRFGQALRDHPKGVNSSVR